MSARPCRTAKQNNRCSRVTPGPCVVVHQMLLLAGCLNGSRTLRSAVQANHDPEHDRTQVTLLQIWRLAAYPIELQDYQHNST